MSADRFSLLFVNAATGLMLGLSILPALDLWPWLRRHNHWAVLIVMMLAWGSVIVLASSFDRPEDLIIRRLTNGLVSLYVAVILVLDDRMRSRNEVKK
jgi:hypothetical protein